MAVSERSWIAQVVRPDGTVLTELATPEQYGPKLYIPSTANGDWAEIEGEAYGRWKLSDAAEWQITYWWPAGPTHLPAFCDLMGNGVFPAPDATDAPGSRDAVIGRLKAS